MILVASGLWTFGGRCTWASLLSVMPVAPAFLPAVMLPLYCMGTARLPWSLLKVHQGWLNFINTWAKTWRKQELKWIVPRDFCTFVLSVNSFWASDSQAKLFFQRVSINQTSDAVPSTQFSPLKGQSNEIFDPQFFASFEPAWATDQWDKIVWWLCSFSPIYSNFSIEKTDSAQYDTALSQKKISS